MLSIYSKIQESVYRKLLICFVIATVCFGCGKTQAEGEKTDAKGENAVSKAPVNITIGKAVAREIPAYIQATGSLTADETSDVSSKASGKVKSVSANVGQFITKGTIIARIDDSDAKLRVQEVQANVNQAIAAVRQAEVRLGLMPNGTFNSSVIPEVRGANANYEQALALLRQAEANEKRYRELVETGDVPMITYETYRTQRDTARAQVNAAKQQLEGAVNTAKLNNQSIKGAQSAVDAQQTQLATAQQAVADTVVRAPFSGYISNRPVAVGEFVSSATVVATILRTNPIKVQIQVAEADVPFVSIGRAVSIEVDAYKDRKFGGVVTAVNPSIDTASRSAVIEAQIENNQNALRTGMFATVKIVREGGNTGIFVPKSAVYNDQATQSYRIFVVEENIVKLRVAQIGTEEGDYIQILSGVNADETVATENLEQLYEGALVSF